jgi:hypothetical protein
MKRLRKVTCGTCVKMKILIYKGDRIVMALLPRVVLRHARRMPSGYFSARTNDNTVQRLRVILRPSHIE